MKEDQWTYQKLDDNYNLKNCPSNDLEGKITGKIIIGVKQWFDENPEERIRLGWIKHIEHDPDEIKYNKQSQYLIKSKAKVDDYTTEDVYHVLDKTEEMMALEELGCLFGERTSIIFF